MNETQPYAEITQLGRRYWRVSITMPPNGMMRLPWGPTYYVRGSQQRAERVAQRRMRETVRDVERRANTIRVALETEDA